MLRAHPAERSTAQEAWLCEVSEGGRSPGGAEEGARELHAEMVGGGERELRGARGEGALPGKCLEALRRLQEWCAPGNVPLVCGSAQTRSRPRCPGAVKKGSAGQLACG
eukprot:72818-Rhodomonas_salina.1